MEQPTKNLEIDRPSTSTGNESESKSSNDKKRDFDTSCSEPGCSYSYTERNYMKEIMQAESTSNASSGSITTNISAEPNGAMQLQQHNNRVAEEIELFQRSLSLRESAVYFDSSANRIIVRDNSPDHFYNHRENILIIVLLIWRYICLFMAVSILVMEIIYWLVGYNGSLEADVVSAEDFFGRNILIKILKTWRPVCIFASILIFVVEIAHWTLDFNIKEICLKFNPPEFENMNTRIVVAAMFEAWKPICLIGTAILLLLIDLVNWYMRSKYYEIF